jgi:hypothetical protein
LCADAAVSCFLPLCARAVWGVVRRGGCPRWPTLTAWRPWGERSCSLSVPCQVGALMSKGCSNVVCGRKKRVSRA